MWGRTRGFGKQFQDFLAVHKLSTVQRKLSPCKPGFSTGNPQIEPGWRWLQPFPPGRKHEIGHAGRGSVGEAGDQPDGAQGLGWTHGGWPVKREISRTARARTRPSGRGQPIWREISRTAPRGSARRKEAGRLSGRSAGPHGPARPGARRSAGQPADQPGRAHELGQAAELSRSGRRSAGYAWAGPHGPQWEKPHHGQDCAGRRRRGNPSRTKEEAPPRMRWRGPSDPAAPDTAISCSASVPLDQPPSRKPARSPSCPVPLASRGAPRMVPFSAVRDFYAYLGLAHKRFRQAISRFFGRPPIVHS